MEQYTLSARSFFLTFLPETASFTAVSGGKSWRTRSDASVLTADGQRLYFRDAFVRCTPCRTGALTGWTALYDFGAFALETVVAVEGDDLRCELRVKKETFGQLSRVFWPAAFSFDLPAGEGYTVLPRMHGCMIPARWPGKVEALDDGALVGRNAYMSFYGQVDGEQGFCLIIDDPADAGYLPGHIPGGKTEPEPFWCSSLGKIGRRTLRYRFFARGADYVALAKCYRQYVQSRGQFVTLREKIDRNPNVAYLIGAPVFHTGIATHISPGTHYYDPEHPEENDRCVPFSQVGDDLRTFRRRGLEKVYLHLDGWGFHGYDNLHPDVFPPHTAAGGPEGMRRLSDLCRSLGYRFGIHDQYRDYYYDAASFDIENAVHDIHGKTPYICYWYGGAQTVLCADLARQYVRRNYDEFERLGIRIDGSYLDVFSIVEPDECFHPEHPMTRSDCIRYRGECLDELTARGIIPSSEEPTDSILPHMALVHHGPLTCQGFGGEDLTTAAGVPIPLFSLVYHECVVIPWSGADGSKGGWSIPAEISPWQYGLMTGGTPYVDAGCDDAALERVQTAAKLQAKLWDVEMVGHEFLDAERSIQRSIFADGTTVTVDFDTMRYEITDR